MLAQVLQADPCFALPIYAIIIQGNGWKFVFPGQPGGNSVMVCHSPPIQVFFSKMVRIEASSEDRDMVERPIKKSERQQMASAEGGEGQASQSTEKPEQRRSSGRDDREGRSDRGDRKGRGKGKGKGRGDREEEKAPVNLALMRPAKPPKVQPKVEEPPVEEPVEEAPATEEENAPEATSSEETASAETEAPAAEG